jgi:hypothetical protein
MATDKEPEPFQAPTSWWKPITQRHPIPLHYRISDFNYFNCFLLNADALVPFLEIASTLST